MLNKRLLLALASLLLLVLVGAVDIPPSQSIPSSNKITDDYYFSPYINFSVPDAPLDVVKFNWNNTNYTIYDDSLVLMYNFDNRSSLGENDTLIKDLSKYGNNGTVYTASVTTNGKFNGAFILNGTTDYIDLPASLIPVIQPNSNHSVLMWIKTSDNSAGFKQLIGQAEAISGNRTQMVISSGTLRLNSGGITYDSSTTVTNGLWNQVGYSYSYNGSNMIYKVYINGVQVGTQQIAGVNLSDDTIRIGKRVTTEFYNGTIDNVLIVNKSLTDAEVAQLYRTSLTKYNSTNWQVYSNQSIRNENLSTTNLNEAYDYGLFVNDTAGNSNSTANVITRIPLLTSTLGNFTTSKGTVKDTFYGVQAVPIISPYGRVTTDDTCTQNGYSDYLSERESFENSKMKVIRSDMYLWYNSASEGVFDSTRTDDGNIKNFQSLVEFAHDNGYKIHFVASYMPEWLANKTTGWCNTTTGTNMTCPPYNYTKWGNLVVNYIDNVTENGLYNSSIDAIEVWNEPYLSSFWLNNISNDNVIKSTEYIKLYNATYDAVKAKYPNIAVGGPSGEATNPTMVNNFLGNMTTKMDFVSIHEYSNAVPRNGFYKNLNSTDWLLSRCAVYGANCSRVIMSEWNLAYNAGTYTSYHGATVGSTYIDFLNNYPTNISSIMHLLSVGYKNTSCSSIQNYTLFNQFNNFTEVPYNVTKNFATYCPAGSTIYASSSNESNLKTVTCKKGNSLNIGLINTDTEAKNVSYNLSNIPSTIRDYDTKTAYTASGKLLFGLVDSYTIKWLGNGIYGEYNGAYWNKPLNEITETNSNQTTILKNTDTSSRATEIYNLTNALIFYGNNSICGDKKIDNNDNNINCTIPNSGNITLLNDFNITYNSTRTYSPATVLSLTSGALTDTLKINSSLSDEYTVSVYNIPVRDCNISSVTITPHGGINYNAQYDCSGKILTITNLNLTYSVASTEVYINYPSRAELQGICYYTTTSYVYFFRQLHIIGVLLSIVVLIGAIGLITYAILNPEAAYERFDSINWESLMNLNLMTGTLIAIGTLAILAIVSIVSVSYICLA